MKAFGRQFEAQREADENAAFADTMIDALGIGDEDITTPGSPVEPQGIEACATIRRHQSPHETAARAKKVRALVAVLRLGKITADEASRMTSAQWAEVASAAKVNMPSAETRARVLAELCESEKTF